jgi:hypothetical protein
MLMAGPCSLAGTLYRSLVSTYDLPISRLIVWSACLCICVEHRGTPVILFGGPYLSGFPSGKVLGTSPLWAGFATSVDICSGCGGPCDFTRSILLLGLHAWLNPQQ